MGVPRHLQVPLSIDTSISYSLDKSMFPGLDDPRYKNEPVLMIAARSSQSCVRRNSHQQTATIHEYSDFIDLTKDSPSSDCSPEDHTELLDDLLEIMDINTDDLLTGLRNTDAFISLVEDVMEGLPHTDELQYLDGPKNCHNTINHNIQQRGCFSDNFRAKRCAYQTPCVPNGYSVSYPALESTINPAHHNSRTNPSAMCFLNGQHGNRFASQNHISNGYAVQVPSVTNDVFRKRKRIDSAFGNNFQKKPCYGNGFVNHLTHQQTGLNTHGYGFIGARHGNQVRVM